MKQVIVMRKDLGMRAGKMIAQGAHASMGAVMPYLITYGPDYVEFDINGHRGTIAEWLNGPHKKVTVRVESEQELLDIYEAAMSSNMIAHLVIDNGLTEFHGVPTKTCCAIGPDTEENLDAITGHLKLI